MERIIESLMIRARWLLAPVYLGLSFALLALAIKFFSGSDPSVCGSYNVKRIRCGSYRVVID